MKADYASVPTAPNGIDAEVITINLKQRAVNVTLSTLDAAGNIIGHRVVAVRPDHAEILCSRIETVLAGPLGTALGTPIKNVVLDAALPVVP